LRLPLPRFTEAQADLLKHYHWPGNVRELQNATERALILSQNGVLRYNLPLMDSPPAPSGWPVAPGFDGPKPPSSGSESRAAGLAGAAVQEGRVLSEQELRELERENTRAALERCGWKVHGPGGAAKLLGVKPTTLISRIRKMGLRRPPTPASPGSGFPA
jgi:DNA-binding NtrC family response regulator